jgi:hypothetical protein
MNDVTFVTNTKKKYKIGVDQLNEYPRSLLTIIALGPFRGNDDGKGNIKTELSDGAMENIQYFYENGIWRNPYVYENRWTLYEVGNSVTDFDGICKYLNLPSYIEEEAGEDDEEDKLWSGMKFSGEQLKEVKKEYETEKAHRQMIEEQERERELDEDYDDYGDYYEDEYYGDGTYRDY